jgi:hypothetical protein
MSRGRYDRTPGSPTTGSNEAATGHATIGRRPILSVCENIDSCPVCVADAPFKYPVVAGDLVYLQFNFADFFNENPVNPVYGWDTTSPSDNFWLHATLEFGHSDDLELPSSIIIRSQNVGYNDGSYQNLILNSTAINQYVLAQGYPNDCFRVRIQTYWMAPEDALSVFYITNLGTPSISYQFEEGDLIIFDSQVYVYNGSGFVFSRVLVDGELIFNKSNGQFYRYDADSIAKPFPFGTRGKQREEYQVCYSYWHKLIDCIDTVLFRGIFGFEDCRGRYYGISSQDAAMGLLPYIDQYRLEGSAEMNGISITATKNENDVITELKQLENWVFKNSAGLPDEIVRRLANTFSSNDLRVNSNSYINASDINKINEIGNYWYVAPTFQRVLCERETDCDDDFSFNPLVICPSPAPADTTEATIENSDGTYSETVQCGFTFVLPDYDYEIFVNGNSEATGSYPAMVDITLNITLTSL